MSLLILLFPFVEIYLIFRIGQVYGFGDFILYCLASGVIGALLISAQGKAVIYSLQTSFSSNQVPGKDILHRTLIIMGGIFIFLPGVLTDFIGLILVLPGTRDLFVSLAKVFLARKISSGHFKVFSFQSNHRPVERDAHVIEAQVLESSTHKID